MKSLKLKKNKEINIYRKHPWVFSGALMEKQDLPEDGETVYLQDANGNRLGFGHYHNGSIAIKLLSFGSRDYTDEFWFERLQQAFMLRSSWHFERQLSNCYRWVHGEGDQLPGLIIDVFDRYVVIQCHTIGMHRHLDQLILAIKKIMGAGLSGIIDKSKDSLPSEYALSIQNKVWLGEWTDELICMENGFRFKVDCLTGQKTGFFLDQRDNRKLVSEYAKDRNILNAYCYSGGFSMYALANEAKHVDSVDVSKKALDLLLHNLELNNLTTKSHESICEDVNTYLQSMESGKYDLIILDPPAFAKSIAKRHTAVQAYKRINLMALKKIAANGLLFTFSCSQVVDENLFYHTIVSAGIESQRNIRILHKLSQGPDHPVSLFHPEGSYLKGLVLLVE